MQILRNDRNGLQPALYLLCSFSLLLPFLPQQNESALSFLFSFFLHFLVFFCVSFSLKRWGMIRFTYQLTPHKLARPRRREPFVFVCIMIITKGHSSSFIFITLLMILSFVIWSLRRKGKENVIFRKDLVSFFPLFFFFTLT